MRSIESMMKPKRARPGKKAEVHRPVNNLGGESLERAHALFDEFLEGLEDDEVPEACSCEEALHLKELLRLALAFWAHPDVCCMPPIDYFDAIVRAIGEDKAP